ncbi:glycosyl transferase family 1, partial [Candidatus Bipolaricaulota bacterium]|nr:glycosyl transferase family 1 [Candidatus Bipolaricaulota bacterium]
RARLPIAIFEYPVYRSDIQSRGFDVISLGSRVEGTDDSGLVTVSEEVIRQAAEKSVEVLTDSSPRWAMIERNVDSAKEHYSLESLERQLADIIGRAGSS